MLKDYVELGAVPFTITVDGFKERHSNVRLSENMASALWKKLAKG